MIAIRKVKLTDGRERTRVASPYHPDFPAKARALGGKWIGTDREWSFDPRDEERVRALCKATYGSDGSEDNSNLVSVQVEMDAISADHYSDLFLFGRQVLRIMGRDSRPRLGEQCIVIDGGIHGGGSRKNPKWSCDSGTVIEIRDLPAAIVAEGNGIKIVSTNAPEKTATAATKEANAALKALLALEDIIIAKAEAGELSADAEKAWTTYQALKNLGLHPGTEAEGVAAMKAALKKALDLAI